MDKKKPIKMSIIRSQYVNTLLLSKLHFYFLNLKYLESFSVILLNGMNASNIKKRREKVKKKKIKRKYTLIVFACSKLISCDT